MFLDFTSGVEVNFELRKQLARLRFCTDFVVHLDKYTAIDFFVILQLYHSHIIYPFQVTWLNPLQWRLNILHKNKHEK
jgi:hypothetical protein